MQNAYTLTILIIFFCSQFPYFCFGFSHSQAVSKDVRPAEGSLQRDVQYLVNFAPEIREIISETKDLVSLGHTVPDIARNVALQEHKFVK